jgi:hypothetical protein
MVQSMTRQMDDDAMSDTDLDAEGENEDDQFFMRLDESIESLKQETTSTTAMEEGNASKQTHGDTMEEGEQNRFYNCWKKLIHGGWCASISIRSPEYPGLDESEECARWRIPLHWNQ